jgi:hypothetical protein
VEWSPYYSCKACNTSLLQISFISGNSSSSSFLTPTSFLIPTSLKLLLLLLELEIFCLLESEFISLTDSIRAGPDVLVAFGSSHCMICGVAIPLKTANFCLKGYKIFQFLEEVETESESVGTNKDRHSDDDCDIILVSPKVSRVISRANPTCLCASRTHTSCTLRFASLLSLNVQIHTLQSHYRSSVRVSVRDTKSEFRSNLRGIVSTINEVRLKAIARDGN